MKKITQFFLFSLSFTCINNSMIASAAPSQVDSKALAEGQQAANNNDYEFEMSTQETIDSSNKITSLLHKVSRRKLEKTIRFSKPNASGAAATQSVIGYSLHSPNITNATTFQNFLSLLLMREEAALLNGLSQEAVKTPSTQSLIKLSTGYPFKESFTLDQQTQKMFDEADKK